MTSESPLPSTASALRDSLESCIRRAREFLLKSQRPDGHWRAPLETDASITAETLLTYAHVGLDDAERRRKMVTYLLNRQEDDGTWKLHPAGGPSLDVTIKAYFALKVAGHDPDEKRMRAARKFILSEGGVENSAAFTKIWLAVLGQVSWTTVPCLAPEMMLLPSWAPFSIHAMAYWCRIIMIPLTIVRSVDKQGCIPPESGCDELFCTPTGRSTANLPRGDRFFSFKRFFAVGDRLLTWVTPFVPGPLHRKAMRLAEDFITERMQDTSTDGFGAIIPGAQNSLLALWALDRGWEEPCMKHAVRTLEGLAVENEAEYWLQPCLSPVWDTGLAMLALQQSGSTLDDEATRAAADWLLQHRTTRRGDWALHVSDDVAPCAWAFQYRNDHYPDVDDTAMVIMALRGSRASDDEDSLTARDQALTWIRAMQSDNGGWGAYDRNNNRHVLDEVPFADHGALLDPPTSDLTGRMLHVLGECGARPGDRTVDRALAFLRREQEPEGCWFGRWGINYIYGTWSALEGLGAVGLGSDEPMVVRAANWLESVQGSDGGWGETPETYRDRELMATGNATPSQTAWAMLGLLAAGRGEGEAAARGAAWLVRAQRADGDWDEADFTGTGFPNVLYLRYHLYRLNFPLMALGRWRSVVA